MNCARQSVLQHEFSGMAGCGNPIPNNAHLRKWFLRFWPNFWMAGFFNSMGGKQPFAADALHPTFSQKADIGN